MCCAVFQVFSHSGFCLMYYSHRGLMVIWRTFSNPLKWNVCKWWLFSGRWLRMGKVCHPCHSTQCLMGFILLFWLLQLLCRQRQRSDVVFAMQLRSVVRFATAVEHVPSGLDSVLNLASPSSIVAWSLSLHRLLFFQVGWLHVSGCLIM